MTDAVAWSPTHTLVTDATVDAARERAAWNAVVRAVLDAPAVDTVRLRLSPGVLPTDHPDLAAALGERCRRDGDGRLVASPAAIRDPLAELLSLSSRHRYVTLASLALLAGDRRVLWHVPDHGTLQVDADADADAGNDGEGGADLADRLRRVVADHPAGLLPATTLAAWRADGTPYELAPPTLSAGQASFDLGRLAGVTVDRRAPAVRLSWASPDGLVGRVAAAVAPSPPERLPFDSRAAFERALAGFETVAAELDRPVDDGTTPGDDWAD